MGKDIQKLVDKYFRGGCTTEEAEQVLAWFDTDEGSSFLDKQLDRELNQIDEISNPKIYSRVPTSRIKNRLDQSRRKVSDQTYHSNMKASRSKYAGVFATAASVLILVTVSVVLYIYYSGSDGHVMPPQENIVYSVGAEEHKVLTLSDGSVVRMNSNSQLIMPEIFEGDRREVTLKGEAYFEIETDSSKPFIVNTSRSVVKVLGTAFNVKVSPKSQNVLVAVKEGKVSFRQKRTTDTQEVFLTENQLGYMDAEKDVIKVERVEVDNYLSWMTRRLVFNNTPFPQVCNQLERIYGIDCSLQDEQLSKIYFTADFERRSLEETLNVIASSLDIIYQMEGEQVVWIREE